MSDPLHRSEPTGDLASAVRGSAEWLVDLFFERRPSPSAESPSPPLQTWLPPGAVEARSVRLAKGRRIACVSLVAGCGTTTIAALLAQRSGGAGARVRLIDLDLVAPTLSVVAGQRLPTLTDALADPAIEGRRWGSVDVIYGDRSVEPGADIADALARLVRRLSSGAAVVVDAGVLVTPSAELVLGACDAVLYVTTPRAAHVHAAVRAAELLADRSIHARLVVARADAAAASAVAAEVGLPLAGVVPEDPFLARDEFRVRAETAHAVDRLCAGLA